MILSVLRNTKGTVKFGVIESFLSPSFLEFILHFAEACSFQYELVSRDVQVAIVVAPEGEAVNYWACKIISPDAPFPMDLKKVTSIDADQNVRAVPKELAYLGLHGALYGYTPTGDVTTIRRRRDFGSGRRGTGKIFSVALLDLMY